MIVVKKAKQGSIMGANDHQLYLSSPDSTYSRSSSISSSSASSCSPILINNKNQTSNIKSFLISDILKPNFGHHNQHDHIEKSNIPFSSSSPTTTNDSSSSSNANPMQAMFPAWVYCTRYSDRPSAGKRKIIFYEKFIFSYIQVLVLENLNHAIQLIQNVHERHLQVVN